MPVILNFILPILVKLITQASHDLQAKARGGPVSCVSVLREGELRGTFPVQPILPPILDLQPDRPEEICSSDRLENDCHLTVV
jgi:hypothetical protein